MPSRIRLFKVGKFLVAGVPAALLALPANYALVSYAHLPKSLAYAIVLLCQVAVNFFANRYFVFSQTAGASLGAQFARFSAGILTFRLADWALYSLLVGWAGPYFVVLQIFNALLFSLFKFRFVERVMEEK